MQGSLHDLSRNWWIFMDCLLVWDTVQERSLCSWIPCLGLQPSLAPFAQGTQLSFSPFLSPCCPCHRPRLHLSAFSLHLSSSFCYKKAFFDFPNWYLATICCLRQSFFFIHFYTCWRLFSYCIIPLFEGNFCEIRDCHFCWSFYFLCLLQGLVHKNHQ